MPAPNITRTAFKSGVRWYSLWTADGKYAGFERHVVSAVSDGSATVETYSAFKTEGGTSEQVATLAFGSGGARLEAVRCQRDGAMTFQIRRNGDLFSGTWAGQPFSKVLPPDFLPNFGNAEWIATLPQEHRGLWGFSRLPMGSDTPAVAAVECAGAEEVRVPAKSGLAWHYVERVGGKERNHWWVDSDRVVVKVQFGLEARLEVSEAAAKTAHQTMARERLTAARGLGGGESATRIVGSASGVRPAGSPATRPLKRPSDTPVTAPAPGVPAGVVDPPSQFGGAPSGSAAAQPGTGAAAPDSRPPAARVEHIAPAPGPAPTRELGERGKYARGKHWFSLWNNGFPAGWECQFVNPNPDGAMLETTTHYFGQDGKWHDSAAVVVFGHQERIANCHFMQDGIQTELGQPFFTLRRIETGFIGTWQGRPYKRDLPSDFVPGFGLQQWVATFPQTPGSKRVVQRLAMAQTEPAACTIECHGEQETELKGSPAFLCKFVERIGDRVRSIWWVDRDRRIRKVFFGLEAVAEPDEATAKAAGTPPS